MLHLAYINSDEPKQPVKAETAQADFNRRMNYKFFKKALPQFEERIKAIQEEIPGWTPTFKG